MRKRLSSHGRHERRAGRGRAPAIATQVARTDPPGGARDATIDPSVVIDARGIRKDFGHVHALDGLDLRVRRGEVHGFLGPNGSGKSTTIRALLGQLRLTGGTLRLFGLDPLGDAVEIHQRLAYVPGDTALWPGLTGGECIDVIGGFSGRLDSVRRDELIARFELDPTRRARTYSKGNRQKVALIAALATDAELYVLDEPTSGLDPLMEARFQMTVREIAEAGRTVLLSSHILDEVEALCDRVTIIRAGRTVSTGSLDTLRANTATTVLATTAEPLHGIRHRDGVRDLTEQPHPDGIHSTFTVSGAVMAEVIESVAAQRPVTLVVRPPALDELFLAEYGEQS
ncbi:MAG: ABC transporter ATP-binding protein [Dermatophilaceae bacterium]